MKKLVIFAHGRFNEYLMSNLKDNKYPFLREILSNRMNLTVGARYKFELIDYSSSIQEEINNLNEVMEFLNKSDEVQNTMKPY